MATRKKKSPPKAEPGKVAYFNRELSWLAFNRRVLEQAQSGRHPLLERVRFLAIVSSNLDEFFEIRVAGLMQQVDSGVTEFGSDGLSPVEQLRRIHSVVASLVDDQYHCWHSQLVPALQNKEIDIFNPSTVNLSIVQTASQVPNSTKATLPGLEFEHFDFNEADPYLAKLQVRQAIAYGTNRQEIISHTVGEITSGIQPLGNRMFVNSQPQYVNNGAAYASVNPGKAESLLKGLGFTKASDGYFQPNYGPQKGQDLTFTIQSTSGNSIRSQTEQLFQAQMKAIGIKINIQNYDANTFFGTNLPNGTYQIAEFAWVSSPFVSGNQSIYCSYTNSANCGQNWIHYANPQVDKLMTAGSSATSVATETADYNAADKILWSDMATLPLYQKPQYFAWSSSYGNLIPNTSNVGIPWNANLWGKKA